MKTVIITGAGRGIGLATAKYLLKKGYKVYGIARGEYENLGFPLYRCDVTDTQKMTEIFREIAQKEGGIYALINNAGHGISGAIELTDSGQIQRMFDVDLAAVVKLCSAIIPFLRESGGGRIVNIGSVASVVPIPFQACYSAAKAAVENFSRALAIELKPFNIKVTCMLFGDTATGFTDARIKFAEGENSFYRGKADKSVRKMERDERKGKSPETAARAIYKVIKKRRPPLRKTVGAGYKVIVFLTRILPLRLMNFIIAKLYA